MRNKIGTLFMIIGALLVFSALGLLLYNQQEAAKAQKAATELLPKLMSEIEVKKQEKSESGTGQVIVEQPDLPEVWQEFQEQEPVEMPEMEIDGDKYIGYFQNNEFCGVGAYCFSDGSVYLGQFKDSQFHGLGVMINIDKTYDVSIYENGEEVKYLV